MPEQIKELFHYTKPNNAVAILNEREFLASEFGSVNDKREAKMINLQCEGRYRIKSDFQKTLLDHYGKTKLFICFSDSVNIQGLWQKYGVGDDPDKQPSGGVCLKFAVTRLLQGAVIYQRVQYKDRKKTIVLSEEICHRVNSENPPSEQLEKEMHKFLIQVPTTKSAKWLSEREWRVFVDRKDPLSRKIAFGDSIQPRSIILGERCSSLHEEELRTVAQSFKPPLTLIRQSADRKS